MNVSVCVIPIFVIFQGVKKDSKLNINVLEMMSSWKDDLIKDHLKEDLQNEAQNGDSENEDAQDDVRIGKFFFLYRFEYFLKNLFFSSCLKSSQFSFTKYILSFQINSFLMVLIYLQLFNKILTQAYHFELGRKKHITLLNLHYLLTLA